MSRAMAEPVAVAIMAKAPIAGLAKTRLIPALGADGAATLAAQLIERTVLTACEAAVGPVTIWCAPDAEHPHFSAIAQKYGVALAVQPEGDLGARMHSAVVAAKGPVLTAGHLHAAVQALAACDAVITPTEDGGYALIALRGPLPGLFSDMAWSVPTVMQETRRRMQTLGLVWCEMTTLWDVDVPTDLDRMRRETPMD
jgi:uncharacterized protein